ncbi:hypothetical protein TI39_contig4338g00007 [Zymoseptoria brevis]|uniref:Uncharacterized protein n=1 Tax=Zymoseptoria brevis TaxID=1047168 RepID=A0A0F4G7G4_9PEZI|nr:hypothetical protein TI39_contig4338g00007 [Zymoseptoria brevis]
MAQRNVNISSAALPYSLPNTRDGDSTLRAAELQSWRDGFQYGAALGGGVGPYSTAGPLGEAKIDADMALIVTEVDSQREYEQADWKKANASLAQYNDLRTLDGYAKLYDDQ